MGKRTVLNFDKNEELLFFWPICFAKIFERRMFVLSSVILAFFKKINKIWNFNGSMKRVFKYWDMEEKCKMYI